MAKHLLSKHTFMHWALLAILTISGLSLAQAQQAEVFSTSEGAIRGYDPVAYFTLGSAQKGDADITHDYKGATWHFASEENRDLFAANPEKYAPAYGGHCAFGLAQGHLVPTDPNAWTIHNDKLYLNYSLPVRNNWSNDIPGNVRKSDANWDTHGF